MTLPSGDDDQRGVATVESVSQSLQRAVQENNLFSLSRTIRGYLEDISKYCDPQRNPSAFRNCQSGAQNAIRPLLLIAKDLLPDKEVRKDVLTEVRIAALEALARVSFCNDENAAAVAITEGGALFRGAMATALRPAEQVQQQGEHLAALQLIQVVAATVPESPVLKSILVMVTSLVASNSEEEDVFFAAFRAVRTTAVEVLVSCSLGRHCREEVASHLTASTVRKLLIDLENDASMRSFCGLLLLANLSGLIVPESIPQERFDQIALPLWNKAVFFDDITACLEAALASQPWPPHSNVYHMPWKMVTTCLHLSRSGYSQQLRTATAPLIVCVERNLAADEDGASALISTDDARAARLATVVLWGLAEDLESLNRMREAPRLKAALQCMCHQEAAARDLLEVIDGTACAPSLSDGALTLGATHLQVCTSSPW